MQKRRCPYIGLDNDPNTVMAYPTLRNCCHRVEPEEPVNLNYQLTHCFTFAHRHCPVLLDQVTAGLPPEIAVYSTKKRATIALWVVVASGMLTAFFILLFGDWQWGGANGGFLDFNGSQVQQETVETPAFQLELPGSATPTYTLTPNLSATLLPSETPVPTDIPATEEPTTTHTSVPSSTSYPTWTPVIPPTSTPTPTSTATLLPSNTSQPTETESPTNTPHLTDTPLPTDPPLPTDTPPPIPSDTPIPLPTDTQLPTGTSTPIPLPPTNTPNP